MAHLFSPAPVTKFLGHASMLQRNQSSSSAVPVDLLRPPKDLCPGRCRDQTEQRMNRTSPGAKERSQREGSDGYELRLGQGACHSC